MKFGLMFANVGPFADPGGATTMARAAEAAGFESVWTVEHVVVPAGYESTYPYDPSGRMPGRDDDPVPDPLVWLTWVAAATSRLRLATGILILPQRNPVVLAKELATLDHLSAGRLDLGVGIGWLAEEFDALGVPFDERAARTDESVAAMRALWTEDRASFEGTFTRFRDCIVRPRPAQGTVPIHVGGHSESAAEAGRDPAGLELTTGGNGAVGDGALDEVAALAELGVDRVVVPSFIFFRDPESSIARYGDEVIGPAGGR